MKYRRQLNVDNGNHEAHTSCILRMWKSTFFCFVSNESVDNNRFESDISHQQPATMKHNHLFCLFSVLFRLALFFFYISFWFTLLGPQWFICWLLFIEQTVAYRNFKITSNAHIFMVCCTMMMSWMNKITFIFSPFIHHSVSHSKCTRKKKQQKMKPSTQNGSLSMGYYVFYIWNIEYTSLFSCDSMYIQCSD